MSWALLMYIVFLVLGGSALLLLATRIGRRSVPGASAFTIFLLAVVLWTFGYAAELASASLAGKTLFASIQYVGISIVPFALFQFAWAYTGHTPLSRNRTLLVAFIPAMTILLVWTNSWHGLIWTQTSLRQVGGLLFFDAQYGLWFWIHTVYTYSMLVVSLLMLFRALWFSPALYQGQFTSLFLAAHVPLICSVLYITKLTPVSGLDLTPFGFIVAGLFLAWGLTRFRLFDLAPLAQRLVFETVGDGLIILDAHQRIVDVNAVAQGFLRQPAPALIGKAAAAVLAEFGAPELWHPEAPTHHSEIALVRAEGPACVEVQSLPLGTPVQPFQGRLVVLRDCTPRRAATAALEANVAQAHQYIEAAQRHTREIALLDQVRMAVARELDLPVVLRSVVEAIVATFGYTQVSLYLIQDDVLVLQHQVGYDRMITHIPITEGVAGRVVRTGIPELLEDVHADPNFLGAIEGIVSEVCVPLVDQGQVVGMLNVESTNGVILTEADLRLMCALSEHITIAMARARLYDETQRTAQQLRAIITSVPMILSATDHTGRIILSEGKGLAAFGRTSGELVGQSMHTMYGDHPAFGMFEDALAGNDTHQIIELNNRMLDLHYTPIVAPDGKISGVLGVALDITEQYRAEKERRMLERSFFEAQKLESLGMLAGGIAHDFNNLLQVILGNASLSLMDLPADAPARTNIARIDLAAQRAADLTRQILAYAGKGRFVMQWLDLSDIIVEMTMLLRASIPKGIHFQTHLDPALPPVDADATQIRQIAMNLITNAAEAIGSTEGVITLTTGVRYLDHAALSGAFFASELTKGSYIYLEVSDTGCGMDAETSARVFEPFFTTKFTGRGLGLAAVFGIVRAHQGALQVQSVPERGTTFTVLLPVATTDVDAEGEAIEPTQSEVSVVSTPAQKMVLVIDDEADVCAVVTRMLQRLGFMVLAANDGRAGIEQFRTHMATISCVLLDLTMPQMTGEQTLAEIHQMCATMPVVLMSGYTVEEVTSRVQGLSVAGFLQKPFTLQDVVSALERARHVQPERALADRDSTAPTQKHS